MDKPTTWRDFDHMRWFLMHEKASVFVEEGDWYLLVHTPCRHLQPDNLCGIYETRPKICRDYTTDKCEYDEDWVYDHYWETAEQVVEYAEAVLGPRRGESFRSGERDREAAVQCWEMFWELGGKGDPKARLGMHS